MSRARLWPMTQKRLLRIKLHVDKPSYTFSRRISTRNSRIFQTSEVRDAINSKNAVVALETTIYTHGLPYPENLVLATRLESLVREHGAVPATCAVLDGVARVGLSQHEMTRLVEAPKVHKVSRRDLGVLTGKGLTGQHLHGGTTIAGTMILAHLAGIKVFATGGLGGVHRGGENSLDISADLTELGRTPVAVISSGPKGFLDIPRTVEYLETQGALVGTFADGREGPVDLPAFWARDSGIRSPMVIRDEAEAAAIIYAQHALPVTSGMFFANPVPAEHSIPVAEMVDIIEEALRMANEAGITGSANTPFVLNAIKTLSGGRSVVANRALVESNVIRGAKVAVELSKLERTDALSYYQPALPLRDASAVNSHDKDGKSIAHPLNKQTREFSSKVDILVAGSLAVDISCDYKQSSPTGDITSVAVSLQTSPVLYTSNPSSITDTLGGVGHNIARAAHLMGPSVRLHSTVADDLAGTGALASLESEGFDTSGIQVISAAPGSDAKTARYICINDAKKDLFIAMSDMSIFERDLRLPTQELSATYSAKLAAASPKWLVLDANWPPAILHAWLEAARISGIRTAFEPVSVAKSVRLLTPVSTSSDSLSVFPNPTVHLATPNTFELSAMHSFAQTSGLFTRNDWWRVIDSLGIPSTGARARFESLASRALADAGVPQQCVQLLPFIPCILAKLGADGVLLTQLLPEDDVRLHDAAAAPYILSRAVPSDDMDGMTGTGVGGVYMRLFPAVESVSQEEIVSVNGVGDTFLGALMAQLVMKERAGQGNESQEAARIEDCVDVAQRAAVLTLKSKESVSQELRTLNTLQS